MRSLFQSSSRATKLNAAGVIYGGAGFAFNLFTDWSIWGVQLEWTTVPSLLLSAALTRHYYLRDQRFLVQEAAGDTEMPEVLTMVVEEEVEMTPADEVGVLVLETVTHGAVEHTAPAP